VRILAPNPLETNPTGFNEDEGFAKKTARLIGTDAKEHVRDAACDNFFLSIGITEICKLKSDTHDQHVSTANDQIETANGKPFSSIRSSKALNMALAPRP